VLADFVEMPLEVRLLNTGETTGQTVVTVKVANNDPKKQAEANPARRSGERVYVRAGASNFAAIPFDAPPSISELEQSSTVIESLPKGASATLTFLVRVVGGTDGQEYRARVFLDGKEIDATWPHVSRFDRQQAFRLWIAQHFLFPPGAIIVIPIGALMLASLMEWATLVTAEIRRKHSGLRIWILRVAAPVIVGLVAFWLIVPLWPLVRAAGLITILACVVGGAAFGWFTTRQPKKDAGDTGPQQKKDAGDNENPQAQPQAVTAP
jgi:hypothetical protein